MNRSPEVGKAFNLQDYFNSFGKDTDHILWEKDFVVGDHTTQMEVITFRWRSPPGSPGHLLNLGGTYFTLLKTGNIYIEVDGDGFDRYYSGEKALARLQKLGADRQDVAAIIPSIEQVVKASAPDVLTRLGLCLRMLGEEEFFIEPWKDASFNKKYFKLAVKK